MKAIFSVAVLATVLSAVSAHYSFETLLVNGVELGGNFKYVRNMTPERKYMPIKFKGSETITPYDDDFRCNKGSFNFANNTDVADVHVGDRIGMKVAVGGIQHPGPLQFYMSRAPGPVQQYDGSGDWFKVHQELTCNPGPLTTEAWCTWQKEIVDFDLPQDLPNGEYLVRVEHIGLHGAHEGQEEFYVSCAQIRVSDGNDNCNLQPTVKIPGLYNADDPALTYNLWNTDKYDQVPGPMIASCA